MVGKFFVDFCKIIFSATAAKRNRIPALKIFLKVLPEPLRNNCSNTVNTNFYKLCCSWKKVFS